MAGNQDRQFRFGAIVHEDYQELAMLLPELEDRLNQNINLKDYTDRVERIYFVPILMPEGVDGMEEERWFDEEKKEILLKVKFDGYKLIKVVNGNFEALMGQTLKDNLMDLKQIPAQLTYQIQQTVNKFE